MTALHVQLFICPVIGHCRTHRTHFRLVICSQQYLTSHTVRVVDGESTAGGQLKLRYIHNYYVTAEPEHGLVLARSNSTEDSAEMADRKSCKVKKVKKGIAVCRQACHHGYGNSHAYGITQCYLPPGRGDIPAFTPAEAGTRFSDPRGMQDISVIYSQYCRKQSQWIHSVKVSQNSGALVQ